MPPLANKARFHDISYKVSQNRGVSPNFAEKACHSPYSQNGLQMSALGILRIPDLPAFSHKELMGHFDPVPRLYCQNDEVSPVVHPLCMPRRGRRYPHGPRSKLPLGSAPHLLSAVPSHGILNGSLF